MPIFMEYDGGAIKGDVTAKGHEKWITLTSCQWGVGRGISTPTGAAAERESSAPSVSEVVVTKVMDGASGPLWTELVKNMDGKKIVIVFTSTSKELNNGYLTYTLENTLVSSHSFSTAGDRPMESLALNFAKVEAKFFAQTKEGVNVGKPDSLTFDLATSELT